MTCFRTKDGKTVHKWCKENDVPYASIWENLDKGLSVEEACQKSLARRGIKNNAKYFLNGRTVSNILGRGSDSYQLFMRRIYKGMTMDEALKGLL